MKNRLKVIFIIFLCNFNIFSQNKKLEINTKAPNIIIEDVFEKKLDLAALNGTKKVLITFHRYASCPICNFKLKELIKNYQELKAAGLEIVMFIESSKPKILQATKGLEIPFYLISDVDNVYYKKYGVKRNTIKMITGLLNKKTRKMLRENWHVEGKREGEGYSNRMGADFVIDLNGNIEDLQYGRYFGDGIDINRVKNLVVK